jgi:hypothetical protein
MNHPTLPSSATNRHFSFDYPFHGLFDTADVTPRYENGEFVFECRLRSRKIVLVKMDRSNRWIDVQENSETQLTRVIGSYISDFMRKPNPSFSKPSKAAFPA